MVRWKGRMRAAHRLFYERYNGPIPDGMIVRHSCDNPGCVNPDHLLVGTKLDNSRDMVERGRSCKNDGERNPSARLTADQARAIFVDPRNQGAIAAAYGIHRTTVNLIKCGKSWAKETAGLSPHRHPLGCPSSRPVG